TFITIFVLISAPSRLTRAAPPQTVDLELAAGKYDRRDTPVSFPLPPSLQSWNQFHLIDVASKRSVSTQLEAPPTPPLLWILDAPLPANQTRRYQLIQEPPAQPAQPTVKVDHNAQVLSVNVSGKPLLQYHIAVVSSDDPKEPFYRRSGFIHPL